MNCPVCDAPLREIEKYGVEVDICTGCKGVWLDRGELEKIIEMESAGGPPLEYTRVQASRPREEHSHHDEHRHRDNPYDEGQYRHQKYDQHGRPVKKRSSWLGDILGSIGGED